MAQTELSDDQQRIQNWSMTYMEAYKALKIDKELHTAADVVTLIRQGVLERVEVLGRERVTKASVDRALKYGFQIPRARRG
jgi:hypothetical protein